ncbi:MAG: hypothetical protein MUC38_04230 [Cyclobacteriaceae bacterium]|nr:hypothetical protein [Cyclobacteriaceae bacterium]
MRPLPSSGFALCLIVALVVGCQDPAPATHLSEFASEFISLRLGGQQDAAMTAQPMINRSFQGLMGSLTGIPGGRAKSDTTLYEPWQSCATLTEETGDDGRVTITFDYGDGCEEGWGDYRYTLFGKFQYTYRYTTDIIGSVYRHTYSFTSRYDNYGGNYGNSDSTRWLYDGTSSYEGESTYDTAHQTFSGWVEHESHSEYEYGDNTYDFRSDGRSSYHEKGNTVERNEYQYGQDDEYYQSTVIRPVFTSYECGNPALMSARCMITPWIPVSGIERVRYRQDGQEGTFEINYGNGECDNIIFVTENGVTTRIDMGLWIIAF